MSRPEATEQRERTVFAAFARCSGLDISSASIQSRQPPLPDICCTLAGTDYFFELAEVVPQLQAQALSKEKMYSVGFPDPEERGPQAMIRILQQKQTKQYEASPVDLLLYFNKDFPMYLPDILPEGAEPKDIDLAAEECKQHGPFKRIWTYCSWTDTAKLLA